MASKSNKGEILAKFFDDGEYTALFADGAVSAACGYAAGQQAYAVFQNGEAVTVKDVEKNIKVLELAAQTGCPVVTFYDSVGAKLAEGLDVLTASAKLNATIAKVSGVVPHELTSCWNWAVAQTEVLKGAELRIETIPAVTLCESCNRTYPTVPQGRVCPLCGSEETVLLQGNEINLKEIEAC